MSDETTKVHLSVRERTNVDGKVLDAIRSLTNASAEEAELILCLDPASLEKADAAKTTAVWLPDFDPEWPDSIRRASVVLVAHDAVARDLIRRGVTEDRIKVVGPVAPAGFVPAKDRAAARSAAGLGDYERVVLVTADSIDRVGPQSLFVQLSLVSGKTAVLFDVGESVEAADLLRDVAPAHDVDVFIFADDDSAAEHWALADVVVTSAASDAVLRALAVNAPVVAMPPESDEKPAARALLSAGVGAKAESMATLAVVLDAVLDPKGLEELRAGIARLDLAGTAKRAVETLGELPKGKVLPRGLPKGLERIELRAGHVPRQQESAASRRRLERKELRETAGSKTFEDKVSADLARLKAQLGDS